MRTSTTGPMAKDEAIASPAASVDDALGIIVRHIVGLPTEEVALSAAAGRVLAGDLAAPVDLWPFPRSAMDGFAVRASDVAQASATHPVRLRITGELFAGGVPLHPVAAGTTMRIATGAPVPEGADAVLPVEHVEVKGDSLVVSAPVPTGKHIFPSAEDAKKGEVVLTTGTVLRSGDLALLASLGMTQLPVVRRATVAILAVGDELIEPNQAPRPGQVREGNTYALAAAVQEAGGIPLRLGIAHDDVDDVVGHICQAVSADALIVCAGMSVGERDVVKEALRRAGVRLLFWRVPMKPGAPAAFGTLGSTPVFGLPGTPGAAMVAFEELVRPALRKMMGYRQINRPVLGARLTEPLQVRAGRRRYLWAVASVRDGHIAVRPLRRQGTATLRSISEANALILVDPETAALPRGHPVRIQFLTDIDNTEARSVPIVSVIGAKGAGKTTLIERLVPEVRRRGYRVGAVKHDVHGFEIDREGTDTWRFTAAGAEIVAIAGPGKMALVRQIEGEMPLAEITGHLWEVDLILVEGYSQEPIPKIEVRRQGFVSDKLPPAGPILATTAEPERDVPALADRIEQHLRLK